MSRTGLTIITIHAFPCHRNRRTRSKDMSIITLLFGKILMQPLPELHPRIQFLACLIHHKTAMFHTLEFHQVVDIRISGFHIIGWINTEHQHIHHPTFYSIQSYMRIVRTHTNVQNHTFFFQLFCIFHYRTLKHRPEIFLAIHINFENL